VTKPSPLTPAVFHILFALSSGERHGYGIMKQVEADTEGATAMGPGTLYGSLKRMLDSGLVEEGGARIDPAMGEERRIYYRLTAAGQSALESEIGRLKRILAMTERKAPALPIQSFG